MPNNLKVVMGAILSDVANARMLGDAQTAEMAQAYHDHAIMRHFPVPRIEIKEVIFDLKMAVTEILEGGETMVETNATALQEFRPETLSQVRIVANIQNYTLAQNSQSEIQLIPTQ